MIGSENPAALAEFYEKILGKKADMTDGDWHGWSVGATFFSVGPHSEVKGKASEPQRIMFNFETSEIQQEFERMKKAGATVIAEPYEMGGGMMIATLSDPEGNYFQLMTPWETPEPSTSPKKIVN